jgi:hypothetical protein
MTPDATSPGSRFYSDMLDIEECRRIAHMALSASDPGQRAFLTREALDLTARVLGGES